MLRSLPWSHDGRASFALGALAFVSLATPLWLLDGYDLASLFTDDAFYYFQIARNVAHGSGATFDGLHATNGFHPLWLVLLVPVFALPGHDLPVRLAGTLEVALIAAAAIMMYRELTARWGARSAWLAAILVFAAPGARGVLRTGLEGALVLAVLVAVWRAWLRCQASNSRSYLRLGAWLGLLVLARIELLVVLIVIVFVDRRALLREPRSALSLVIPPAATAAAYVSVSWMSSGLALPVSGMVKRAWALDAGAIELLGLGLPRSALVPLALGCAVLLLGAVLIARQAPLAERLRHARVDGLLLAGAAVLAAQLCAVGHLARWYWGPIFPGLAALTAAALHHRAVQTVAIAVAIAGSLARAPYAVAMARAGQLEAHKRGAAADALELHTPAGARIGAWNGGMLGYYSGRHIVMLDGLANDADFYRRVTRGRDLDGYLRDEHIELLAVTGCKPPNAARNPAAMARYELVTALQREATPGVCGAFTLWRARGSER